MHVITGIKTKHGLVQSGTVHTGTVPIPAFDPEERVRRRAPLAIPGRDGAPGSSGATGATGGEGPPIPIFARKRFQMPFVIPGATGTAGTNGTNGTNGSNGRDGAPGMRQRRRRQPPFVIPGPQGTTGATGIGTAGQAGPPGMMMGRAQRRGRPLIAVPRQPLQLGVGARVKGVLGPYNITNSVFQVLSFEAAIKDTGGFFQPGNVDRLIIPQDGWYTIGGCVDWATNTTGSRWLSVRVGSTGNDIAAQHVSPEPSGACRMAISTCWYLNAGDYVRLFVFQNTGGTLAINITNDYSPQFFCIFNGQ